MPNQIHIGQISTLVSFILDARTIVAPAGKGWEILPLDASEKLECLGKIKSNRWIYTTGYDLSSPYLYVSRCRVACIDWDGNARSCWFDAEPGLDNPGYNPIWGFHRGKPKGVTAVKMAKIDKQKRMLSASIKLYSMHDMGNPGEWQQLQPFELRVDKDVVDDLHTLLTKIYQKTQKPVSFKQLYTYFSLGDKTRKELEGSLTAEELIKRSKLSPTP